MRVGSNILNDNYFLSIAKMTIAATRTTAATEKTIMVSRRDCINKNLIAFHAAVVSVGYCLDDSNNILVT